MSFALRAYAEYNDPRGNREIGPRLLFEFSRELLPNYGWVFPTGDGLVNIGVGGPLRGLRRHGSDLKTVLADFADNIRARGVDIGELRAQRAHYLPLVGGMPRLTYPRVALVGDAGSMINPVSGEGIAYAVSAAAQVIEALPSDLRDGLALSRCLGNFERRFRRSYRGHFVSSRIAHRLMCNPYWAALMVRAAQRDPKVLHDAIDLLFGFGKIHVGTVPRIIRSGLGGATPVGHP